MPSAFRRRRHAAAALAFALLTAAPVAGQPVEGGYRREPGTTDRMTVRSIASGRIAVHIETAGEAGQSCEVDEELELQGSSARFSDLENAARDWSIAFAGDRAFVSYAGTHPWYCGPRADFRGEWRRE